MNALNSTTQYVCENVEVTKNDRSEVSIKATIPADAFKTYRAKAITKLGADVKMDGFRQGHIPNDVLEKHLGEEMIMQEAANIALGEQYPLLVDAEKLPVIGTPRIAITKLAAGNPLEFTVEAALMPVIELPDYKTIAQKHNANKQAVTVTDEEVQDTLTHIRRERAKIERIEQGMDPQEAQKEAAELDTLALPGLDDAFVAMLGAENVDAFTEKLRENIKNEKEMREREKNRIGIIEDIIGAIDLPLPEVLIEHELRNMETQFAHDLEHQGTNLDAYLQQANKTRDDLHREWREGAEKRAKMQLILREVAEKEGVQADPQLIEQEVEHLRSHAKDADEGTIRAYVTQQLRTEAVFRWLEEQK